MLIELENVGYFIKNRQLLVDVSLGISSNQQIGILGRNGSGKSTLIEILAGNILPETGKRKVHPKARILIVKQDLPEDEITALEWLRNADIDLKKLDEQVENASDDALGDLLDQVALLETERYEKLAPQVLTGLGLTEDECNLPMKNLSGGFRMRIAIASALIQAPDVLFLDEPTNHLDLESTVWFMEFLKQYKNTYVIISHDTVFLNQMTNIIYHIQSGQVTAYNGNYDLFVQEYALKREQATKNNLLITIKQKHAQDFIDEHGEDMDTAKLAQSRVKFIQKIEKEKVTLNPEEPDIKIEFPEPNLLFNPIIDITNAVASYGDKIILKNVNLTLQNDSRIGLLGRNGQGKSTLVRLLVGRLKSEEGNTLRTTGLRIGYTSQNQTDEMDEKITVFEQMKKVFVQMRDVIGHKEDQAVRALLGDFGFSHDAIAKSKIGELSGGEKSRLAFAMIAALKPHIIIMDEPTNHLDIKARDELIAAINNFTGAVILVSHDWHLLEKTMKNYLLVENQSVKEYKHELKDYRKNLLKQIKDKSFKYVAFSSANQQDEKTEQKEVVSKNRSGLFASNNNTNAKASNNNSSKSKEKSIPANNSNVSSNVTKNKSTVTKRR